MFVGVESMARQRTIDRELAAEHCTNSARDGYLEDDVGKIIEDIFAFDLSTHMLRIICNFKLII